MRDEVRTLFPAGVAGSELFDPAHAEALWPEEEAAVERAIDKRRTEFALGRTCARRALAALGVPMGALPQNPDRSVAWPAGFVGSITHADGYVAAVAASSASLSGVGIDAELKHRVQPRLWSHIATEPEREWLSEPADEPARLLRASLLFSAKESFYKAQYCVSRAWVGFHDVHFQAGSRDGEHQIALIQDIAGLAPRGTCFVGRSRIVGEHVITACAIAH